MMKYVVKQSVSKAEGSLGNNANLQALDNLTVITG